MVAVGPDWVEPVETRWLDDNEQDMTLEQAQAWEESEGYRIMTADDGGCPDEKWESSDGSVVTLIVTVYPSGY